MSRGLGKIDELVRRPSWPWFLARSVRSAARGICLRWWAVGDAGTRAGLEAARVRGVPG
jgi:hypothetical protein